MKMEQRKLRENFFDFPMELNDLRIVENCGNYC